MSENTAGGVGDRSQMADESFLAKLGGPDKLSLILTRLMDKLLEDPRTKNRFISKSPDLLKEGIKAFLLPLCRGETLTGLDVLEERHRGMGVTAAEFDVLVGYVEKAAWEMGCMHEVSQGLANLTNTLRDHVIEK